MRVGTSPLVHEEGIVLVWITVCLPHLRNGTASFCHTFIISASLPYFVKCVQERCELAFCLPWGDVTKFSPWLMKRFDN